MELYSPPVVIVVVVVVVVSLGTCCSCGTPDKIKSYFSYFNPLTPKSDWHLISPYNITSEPHINVTRIKEVISN